MRQRINLKHFSIGFLLANLIGVIVLLLVATTASASRYGYVPPTTVKLIEDNRQWLDNEANAAAASAARSAAQAAAANETNVRNTNQASAAQLTRNDALAMNEGVTNSTSNYTNTETSFLSLSLMFPNAVDCFKGAQAGGGDEGAAGFLGFHILDNNCWFSRLAQLERDAGINARLKCASKMYRNAVAFQVARKDRQMTCVQIVTASNLELIAAETERVQAEIDRQHALDLLRAESIEREYRRAVRIQDSAFEQDVGKID